MYLFYFVYISVSFEHVIPFHQVINALRVEKMFVQQELYEKQFLIATPKRKLADSIKIFRIHTFCDPEITHFGLLKQHLSMA